MNKIVGYTRVQLGFLNKQVTEREGWREKQTERGLGGKTERGRGEREREEEREGKRGRQGKERGSGRGEGKGDSGHLPLSLPGSGLSGNGSSGQVESQTHASKSQELVRSALSKTPDWKSVASKQIWLSS